MAKKSLTPSTVSVTNISDLPDQPTISATALKATFDKYGADDKPYINGLIDELADETANNSGSNTIGHNSTSITADNAGDALEENRVAIDALETADTNNVKLTGNQTIAGTKTFSSNIVVPEVPALDTHATSKAYVDSQSPLTIPNDSLTELKMAPEMKKQAGGVSPYELSLISKQLGGGYLINSNFLINQEAVTGTVVLSSGEYGHDMWKGGSAGCTYTFSESNGIVTINISAGSLIQTIEGSSLDVGTYVLSWSGTSQGKIGTGSFSSSGVTENISGGSDVDIEFNVGLLAKCKFELGSTPTDYRLKTFSEELHDCLRYFWKTFRYTQAPQQGIGTVEGAIIYVVETAGAVFHGEPARFPVQMRTIPTITTYNPVNANANWYNSSTAADSGTTNVVALSEDAFLIINNPQLAGDAAGNLISIHVTADARI